MNSFPLQITGFISSPGDLSPERSALLQLFEQLNTNVAKYRFKVFVYENDTPALLGMSPQEIVNHYGLAPWEANILISMLWSRIGSPLRQIINPMTNLSFRSGTEYEILKAYEAAQQDGKPKILLYRCNRAVPLPHSARET